MRVVGGELRGRRLVAPPGSAVRPTSDRVREAIFNVLATMIDLNGATVVDLFAGSGALGIEAVSRGAAHAVLVERDRAARHAIAQNVEALEIGDRVRIVAADVAGWVDEAPVADVVFVDPPYRFDSWPAILDRLDGAVIVAESDREVPARSRYRVTRSKRYGSTVVTFLEARAQGDDAV